ncbi:MAG: GNAT family N-acetyltransferase [Rubrivivax sp.]|nr:GNAT family N-acetyltransferase [Rubrivivax sp.]
MTSIRPMQQKSFDAYRLASAQGYAHDNVTAGRWPDSGAFERALEDFDQSLPQGLSTPNNFVFDIRDDAKQETVGVIWFGVVEKNGIKSAFVYDVEVIAKHQRQGHARATFELLEPIVRQLGLQRIGLHVFKQNTGAQALYSSLGYEVTGINMLKQLRTQ